MTLIEQIEARMRVLHDTDPITVLVLRDALAHIAAREQPADLAPPFSRQDVETYRDQLMPDDGVDGIALAMLNHLLFLMDRENERASLRERP